MSVHTAVPGQLVVLSGRLDVATVGRIRPVLQTAIDVGRGDLLVDVAHVDAIDMTGLGMLVGAHHRASGVGRRLVLCRVPDRLLRLLRRARLHRVIRLVDEPERALHDVLLGITVQ